MFINSYDSMRYYGSMRTVNRKVEKIRNIILRELQYPVRLDMYSISKGLSIINGDCRTYPFSPIESGELGL